MEFVDRIEEQKRLKQALNGKATSFIVVYGRRRCGKSTLIKHILKPNDVYFMADLAESKRQMELFASMINQVIPNFDNVIYPDWRTLLENLNTRLPHKITICLDEFPYLAKAAPELPSILQRMLDSKEKLRFNLIICGSSQQLMHGLVLETTAPLFGRADEIIRLQPMKAVYLKEVLKTSNIETIEEYSVWGGIPRYWELRLKEKNLRKAIERHIFASYGILAEEPMRLFLDDMRDTSQSFTILSLIATGAHRLSEIAARMDKPATSLTAPLDKLRMLGYIEREIPFNENPKNSKKSLYKISDPFIRFYFHFVVPNRSYIEVHYLDLVMEQFEAQFPSFVAEMWEKQCRAAVPFLKINGKRFKSASRWWGTPVKNTQLEFDVMAESTDGKSLLVGECKWSDKKINPQILLAELQQKAQFLPFAKDKNIIPCLFLKNYKGDLKNVFTVDKVLRP